MLWINRFHYTFVQEGSLPDIFSITELGHQSCKEKDNLAIAKIKKTHWCGGQRNISSDKPLFHEGCQRRLGTIYLWHLPTPGISKKYIYISELSAKSRDTWTAYVYTSMHFYIYQYTANLKVCVHVSSIW